MNVNEHERLIQQYTKTQIKPKRNIAFSTVVHVWGFSRLSCVSINLLPITISHLFETKVFLKA